MKKRLTFKKIDWQDFFISVIGTAIGIAITFIVDGMLERRNKAQAQRLTAIMVIHDIDNTVDIVKEKREEEERNGELLRYILKQKDHLEGVPYDTLTSVLGILADSRSEFSFDTSKEKIFNSDLDTWQNLGNMAFLDNVQTFYHYRQGAQEGMNESTMWQRPISNEEYMQLIMRGGWVTKEAFAAAIQPFLKEKLQDKRVVYYINVSSSRLDYLTQLIDYWTGLNDENKFLMGITDQELEDYVKNINKKGVPLNRSKLLGHWVMTIGEQTNEYDFHGDHSYDFSVDYASAFRRMQFFSGRLKMTLSYSGEWAFQGDSLALTPDYNTVDLSVDPSGLVPEENMQDSLDAWVNRYREQSINNFKEMADKGEKRAFKASVDSSNDKMEWTGPDGAVREFNGYPEYCLACAGYLGMAVAHLWDKDWAKYMDAPYDFFQSERGFDDMDDYITGNILRESKHSVAAMHSLSAEAYHFLMKSGAEAGTAEAYRFFLINVEVMYKMGAAIWLNRLGYKFEKVSLV